MTVTFMKNKKEELGEIKPCPICGKKDQVYVMGGVNGTAIGCIRCEIDTYHAKTLSNRIEHWNNLPRDNKNDLPA
jgi:hypothetical protein